jgi:heme-degrading monooxygenase HmoA
MAQGFGGICAFCFGSLHRIPRHLTLHLGLAYRCICRQSSRRQPINLHTSYRHIMILEVAPLCIRPGHSAEFEAAFQKAQAIISSMPGYVSHELLRCVERTDEYVLLVRWRSLEDHEEGFRKSSRYQDWKSLLHHFYEPFPTVLHYEHVSGTEFEFTAAQQP